MTTEHADNLDAELQRLFGLQEFRPLQREIVSAVLAGEDVLAVLATGRGKSLCYQLPAQLLSGLTVVVSPLLALMRDQLQSLTALGLGSTAAMLSSSQQTRPEQETVLQRALANELRLLFIAPESLARLCEKLLNPLYEARRLARFVIDEAHCILQWGDFRPEYSQLNRLRQSYPTVPILALTATANAAEQEQIAGALRIFPKRFIGSANRPELHYSAIWLPNGSQVEAVLLQQLQQRYYTGAGAVIIYGFSKRLCEKLAAAIKRERPSLKVRVYHAGLSDGVRSQISDEWYARKLQVVCATVAFGMGINREDVRLVLHVGMPSTLTRFAQESGRAGRDGEEAQSVLIYWEGNFQTLCGKGKQTPSPELLAMWDYCVTNGCRRKLLLQLFNEVSTAQTRCCDNCDLARQPRQQTIQEAFRKK